MQLFALYFSVLLLFSCGSKDKRVFPRMDEITESVYAPAVIKSVGQYHASVAVGGLVKRVFATQGALVQRGSPILEISGDVAEVVKQTAFLEKQYANATLLGGQLKDLDIQILMAKAKRENDSLLFVKQKNLWANGVGRFNDVTQLELNAKASKSAHQSLLLRRSDLERQLKFDTEYRSRNLQAKVLSRADYILRSKITGKIYQLEVETGEMATSQTNIALIGDANLFLAELQVDENDIAVVRIGQRVLLHMDSYKERLFEAVVIKIASVMDQTTRAFKVDARLISQPVPCYPNLTAEANIIISSKKKALLIPRNCISDKGTVILANGKERTVKIGLKDYQWVQILEGLKEGEEIKEIMP